MKKISIITSTGSQIGDMVLCGVYGTMEQNEGQPLSKFKIAPEFTSISHLFSLLNQGTSPIKPNDAIEIEVEDDMEAIVKAQFMRALTLKWGNMYKNVIPGEPGLMTSMLQGESAQVSNGARAHLTSMGMQAWMVPVTMDITAAIHGADLPGNERGLIQTLPSGNSERFSIDEDHPVVHAGIEVLTQALAAPVRDIIPEPTSTTPAEPAPWAQFQGIEAKVAGSMIVVAADAQGAIQAAKWLISARTLPAAEFMPHVEFNAEEILSVQNMNLAHIQPQSHDDEWGDDESYDRPGERG